MARCNCNATEASGCQCSLTDSDCFSIVGDGSETNPFYVTPILDEDTSNLMECSPSGLGSFLPPEIAEPPRVQVVRTVDQTIPTSTVQIVSFDTLPVYDTANMYDGASNAFRVNIQFDGLYCIHVQAGWEEPTAEAFASFGVFKMPSDTSVVSVAAVITLGPGTPTWRLWGSNDWELEAGDYLEARVFQNTGVDLKLQGARITARWVAPLS